ADGSLVQRNRDGSDLLLPLAGENGAICFLSPVAQPTSPLLAEDNYRVGDLLTIKVQGSQPGTMTLWDNGVQIAKENNVSLLEKKLSLQIDGMHEIEARLQSNGQVVSSKMQLLA